MEEQQAQMKRLLEEEVKMPQVFDGTSSKVSRYVKDCRRYTEKKMKEKTEEDKICWIVSYVQGDRMDKWKERIVDELVEDKWKDRKVEDILKEIEREFGKDMGKGMDGFWNAVKEKEVEKKEEKPIVVVAMPKKTNGKKRR